MYSGASRRIVENSGTDQFLTGSTQYRDKISPY